MSVTSPRVPAVRARAASAAATILAMLLAVVGCSSPAVDTPTTAPSAPSTTPAEGALLPGAEGKTAYPLTLESPFGKTVLEQRPERIAIVTASTVDTDALIALGGTPVLAPSTVDRNPWLDAATVSNIEDLWDSAAGTEVSAEAVAASKPDLIVNLSAYDTVDQARFDQLSAIAPVLYAPANDLTWQEITQRLGEAVDLSGAAAEIVDGVEKSIAQVKAAHPEFEGKTAAHVIAYEEEWGASYVSAPGTDTARLFEALGFVLPENAEKFAKDGAVSDELISLIDADFLLVSTFEEGTADYFVKSPLFQALPAAAKGNVVFNPADQKTGINYFAWGLNVQSAVSVPWLVDQLADFAGQALS